MNTSDIPTADRDRRCLVMYEVDLGRAGLEPPETDDLRLASGDVGADEEGERWEGGV